ncbi:uncharacterized protein LOC127859679 [Dreissena polymorpha]|uniref:uncharacterized protein LOC127859679 n=1 Tax=Dreissena polymorpha TaxID=45954 RepID=UPI002263BB06|nr:uncharacterized protein LOC127859679 [Dreissena polymorpha]
MCPGISDDLLTIDDSKHLARLHRTPTGGTERIHTLHLNSAAGLITIFSVYAPTLGASDEDKDTFYDQLDSLVSGIPKVEPILLLGDVNARVGTDHQSWSSCIGHYGTGKMNDNGQRLPELCSYYNLCITNTFFQSKPQHRVSWMHPRSRRWHQLDHVITRRSLLSSVLGTRSYHSADCDSDHALVCSRMRSLPRKLHCSKPPGRPCIDIARIGDCQRREEFVYSLENAVKDLPEQDVMGRWTSIRDTIYDAAIAAFGKKEGNNPDWFNANLQELEPVLATKRSALLAYRKSPCEKTPTPRKVQRTGPGLFRLLEKIGCPPKLRSMVVSFNENMKGTVVFDGSSSEPFLINSGVKQGCVLAPTLFGIFFSMLLKYAFDSSTDGINIHTRYDGKLFNLARLRARTKVTEVLVREMLFSDDAALATHTEEAFQRLKDLFATACSEFGLTVSLKKTNIMSQDASNLPCIKIGDYTLEVVEDFTYLGSTTRENLSIDTELSKRIAKASATMAGLTMRVWKNKLLTEKTKTRVYQACVLSTLLYGSETWTTLM